MKKLIFLFLLASPILIFGQKNIPEVTDEDIPVIWLGIDYSQAVYIGDRNKFMPQKFHDIYAEKSNFLIENEDTKYDLHKFLVKNTVQYNISVANASNQAAPVILCYPEYEEQYTVLSDEGIQNTISKYDFGELKGVGVVLIMRTLDKSISQATAYLTYINIDTKTVIYSTQLEGRATGFGLAVFWTNPVIGMLKTMNKKIIKGRL